MNETQGSSQSTERILLEAVETMRKNPEKYRDLHKQLKGARTDEDRVKRLLNFATSERDIAKLMPSGSQTETAAAITTVTVTTVFIIVDSAY